MKKFKLILIVVVLIVVGLLYFYFFGEKSNGMVAGTLSKLSNKGLIFKTWEGDLFKGMFIGESSAAAGNTNMWQFSVKDDQQLIDKLNNYMGTGQRVQLHYSQKWVTLPWRGDTPYIVDDVTVVPGTPPMK